MRNLTAIGVLTVVACATSRGMGPERPAADELLAAAARIAGPVLAAGSGAKRNYPRELSLEALLEIGQATGDSACRERVLKSVAALGLQSGAHVPWSATPELDIPRTPNYQSQLFGSVTYALYRATEDRGWLPAFVSETERVKREIPRSPEGAVMAPRGQEPGHGPALLLDFMQEYVARMARTGSISGDRSYYREGTTQLQIHRDLLRDPKTGLWRQGRGWLPDQPNVLSPGAWSRGHGWLMRGLIGALDALPKDSQEFAQVKGHLQELADALAPLQQPDGTWHALLHRPAADSLPDTSGTAMIATGLSRAWREGWLRDARYVEAAQRAFAALPPYVAANGDVRSASPGPGPLVSETKDLAREFPARNAHGTFAVLFATAEAARLAKHTGRALVAPAVCAPKPTAH